MTLGRKMNAINVAVWMMVQPIVRSSVQLFLAQRYVPAYVVALNRIQTFYFLK